MATTTTTGPGTGAAGRPISSVRLPEKSIRSDLRAMKIVWRREIIRFRSDKLRMFTSLLQPLLFLLVLGTGLSSVAGRALPGELNYRTFIYPGVLAMAVLFTAMFSAGSIVWDREFGFLREMLVAPVSRTSLVLGKCLGGATVATFQGLVILALAPLVGVPWSPSLILILLGEMMLLAFTLTAFGTMLAARITNMQAFMAVMQVCTLPLFFLSGALFPLNNLPGWLTLLTHLNPLTYAVAPLRAAVFSHLDVSPAVHHALAPGVTWGSYHVPIWLDLTIVAVVGAVSLAAAVAQFRKAE